MFLSDRMQAEAETIQAMIRIYCRKHHGGARELCEECRELAAYAQKRLDACPFQEGKTTCGKCPVHCYKPGMRERIRKVMREVGPKMIFHHPVMALRHFLDGLRKEPQKER